MSQTITREELRTFIANERPFVLAEVLGEEYWRAGHIPGAIAMPLASVEAVARRAIPAKDTEVVLYCASETCQNSHVAATKLRALGYTGVRVYRGGKAEWKDAGLPLEAAAEKEVA